MTASDLATPLHVRKVKAQHGKEHDQAVARKIADLNEPNQHDEHQTRRRKRDVFFAFFKSAKHGREESKDAASKQLAVPVQLPIGYMNANHKGCLVSGKRVSYSKYMHQGRKSKLTKSLECTIPEDEQVLEFPATVAQIAAEKERALLEASENMRTLSRGLFFG